MDLPHLFFLLVPALALLNDRALRGLRARCTLQGMPDQQGAMLIMALGSALLTVLAGAAGTLLRELAPALPGMAIAACVPVLLVSGNAIHALVRMQQPALYAARGYCLWLPACNALLLSLPWLAGRQPALPFLLAHLASALAFIVIMMLLAALLQRPGQYATPPALRGLPVATITTLLMTLALSALGRLLP